MHGFWNAPRIVCKMQKSVNIKMFAARHAVNGKKLRKNFKRQIKLKDSTFENSANEVLFVIVFHCLHFVSFHSLYLFVCLVWMWVDIHYILITLFRVSNSSTFFIPSSFHAHHSLLALSSLVPSHSIASDYIACYYFPNDTVLQPETINFSFDASFAPFSKLLLFIVLTWMH